MTDKEILALLDSDPSEGLRVMIGSYSSLVYTIVYSKLGHVFATDDIEEFVSYIFSCIYHRHGEIDFSRGTLKGYIATVAKRLCIDEYRKTQARIQASGTIDEYAELIADARNMQEDVEQRMDEAALVQALKSLGKTDRMVLVKRYYYNQTSVQIAKDLHTTDAAVRKRIERAMNKIRNILLSQGG